MSLIRDFCGCDHIHQLFKNARADPQMDPVRSFAHFIENNLVRIPCNYIYSENGIEYQKKDTFPPTYLSVNDYHLRLVCEKCKVNEEFDTQRQINIAKSLKNDKITALRAIPCSFLSVFLWNDKIKIHVNSGSDFEKLLRSDNIERGMVQHGKAYYGESCYLNSSMQAIMSCEPIMDCIIKTRIGSPLCVLNKSMSEELVRRFYRNIFHSIPKDSASEFVRYCQDMCDIKGTQQVADEFMRKLVSRSISIAEKDSIINNRDCWMFDQKQDSNGCFLFNDVYIDHTDAYQHDYKKKRDTLFPPDFKSVVSGTEGWFGESVPVLDESTFFILAEPGLVSMRRIELNGHVPSKCLIHYGNGILQGYSRFEISSVIVSESTNMKDGLGQGHIVCLVKEPEYLKGVSPGWTLFDDERKKSLGEEELINMLISEDGDKTFDVIMVDSTYREAVGNILTDIRSSKKYKNSIPEVFLNNPYESKNLTLYYFARNMMSTYMDCYLTEYSVNLVDECTSLMRIIGDYEKELSNEPILKKGTKELSDYLFSINYENTQKVYLKVPSSGNKELRSHIGMRNAACRLIAIGLLCNAIKKSQFNQGNLLDMDDFIDRYRFSFVNDVKKDSKQIKIKCKNGKYIHGSIVCDCYEFDTVHGEKLFIKGIVLINKNA